MGVLKSILVAAAGAAASYVATQYVKKLLDEKPLDQRVADAKKMADVYKTAATDSVNDLKGMGKEQLDSLIEALKAASDKLDTQK